MNRKVLSVLGVFLPVGALLLSACDQPSKLVEPDLALNQTKDNWGPDWDLGDGMMGAGLGIGDGFGFGWDGGLGGFNDWDLGLDILDEWDIFLGLSEWGQCNDTLDNDGNGLADMADPACHILGPIRDLSLYDYPFGHNYDPAIWLDIPGGPGFDGWFRNPAQMAAWFRFLTEPDGNVAGIDLLHPGVNPEVVPFPAPLPGAPVPQGTFAQGNNNNLDWRAIHTLFMDHDFLPGMDAIGPGPLDVGDIYVPDFYDFALGIPGGDPGLFYRSQGPWGGNGSQGAVKAARTGNPDHR